MDAALAAEGPTFCEIFTDTQQVWEPKSATKRLPDGTLVSPPLEDLAPFLPREELDRIDDKLLDEHYRPEPEVLDPSTAGTEEQTPA